MTPTTEEGQDVVLYGADKIIDFIIPTKALEPLYDNS
jgi:hypothetical protein